MLRKRIMLLCAVVCCLLFWTGWVKGVQAEDFIFFLPIVQDGSLRGEIVFYQYPQQGPIESAEIMKLHLPNRTIAQLTQNAYFDSDPAWSPDGKQIAYSSWPNGNGDIFVMEDDGSNPTQVTATAENDTNPAWSPDGSRIVFTREFTHTERSLFLVTLADLQVTRLTTGTADYSPDWSPDGQHLAFSSFRDGDWELYIMALNAMTVTQVTHNDYEDSGPVWSPDGTKLLAYALGQLYLINADGTGVQFLPSFGAGEHDWSPDGTKIVYDASTKFTRELAVWRLQEGVSEDLTTPDGPMFENSLRNGPQWFHPVVAN